MWEAVNPSSNVSLQKLTKYHERFIHLSQFQSSKYYCQLWNGFELYFLLNSCVQASIDTGEPWWLQLSRYLTLPRPVSPYAKPVFYVKTYWLHRPRMEICSHRLSIISPSVQGFYRHKSLFSNICTHKPLATQKLRNQIGALYRIM